jgi:hypothetical protein
VRSEVRRSRRRRDPGLSRPVKGPTEVPISPLTLPIEFLHERLTYDPATGELRWRPWSLWNGSARCVGKIAGGLTPDGYVNVALTYLGEQRKYRGHRIAFAMTYGRWPLHEIDHKNRVRSDNRIANLREATDLQNAQNARKRVDNNSGYVGVSRNKKHWSARIRVNTKLRYLGCFASAEDAGRAYLAAKAQLHPFATVGG